MAANQFQAILTRELTNTAPFRPQESLKILQEFCEGVEASTSRGVTCTLERGYLVNDGQEWKPMIQATGGGPSYALLRAYVSAVGWPVKLSLYDGPMRRCQTADELRAELEDFLKEPSVVDQIRFLMARP